MRRGPAGHRPALTYMSASNMASGPSKSAASHQHRSPSSSGYRPMCTSPFRCEAGTAGVSGGSLRSSCRIPFCQPPRTAGTQPDFPVRWLSYLMAYTSGRAANSAPKNAALRVLRRTVVCPPGRCLEEGGLRGAGRGSLPRGQIQQLEQPRVLRPQPRPLSLDRHRDLSHENTVSMRDLPASKILGLNTVDAEPGPAR